MGLGVGIVGLSLTILRPQIVEALEPPAPVMTAEKLADATVDAGGRFARRVVDRVRGKVIPAPAAPVEPPPKVLPWDWYIGLAGPGLGLLAATSGLAGYFRREDLHFVGPALTVGFLAVAWVHIVTALVIALVIVFVIKFGGHIGS